MAETRVPIFKLDDVLVVQQPYALTALGSGRAALWRWTPIAEDDEESWVLLCDFPVGDFAALSDFFLEAVDA